MHEVQYNIERAEGVQLKTLHKQCNHIQFYLRQLIAS